MVATSPLQLILPQFFLKSSSSQIPKLRVNQRRKNYKFLSLIKIILLFTFGFLNFDLLRQSYGDAVLIPNEVLSYVSWHINTFQSVTCWLTLVGSVSERGHDGGTTGEPSRAVRAGGEEEVLNVPQVAEQHGTTARTQACWQSRGEQRRQHSWWDHLSATRLMLYQTY